MAGSPSPFTRRIKTIRNAFKKSALAFRDEWRIRYEVAASLKFKNVAHYLPEWIEFHLMVGVERFFLYDNNSTDNPREILEPYIRAGVVILHHWPEVPAHPGATAHCIEKYGHLCRWIAFLDDDEFLFPVKGGSLKDALKRYEAFPAVAVHWVMFASSGHRTQPDGLVISNYLRSQGAPQNTFKSVVNPRLFAAPKSMHYSTYKNRMRSVNERFEPVKNSHGVENPTVDILRINHYWTKSHEDGVVKMTRGRVDSYTTKRDMDTWAQLDRDFDQTDDTLILRYEEELKQRLMKRGFSFQSTPTGSTSLPCYETNQAERKSFQGFP